MHSNIDYTKIYLCAGGTGGHLFPALATARKLISGKRELSLTVISDKVVNEPGMDSVKLTIPRRSRKIQLPLFILAMMMSFLKCLRLFLRTKPDLVVGFGGYPSVPAVLAAQVLRISTVLHEQNAYIGRGNRYLLKRAQLVALSFEKTEAFNSKIPHIVTGNPVRIQPCSVYKPMPGSLNLFVTGGSQGTAFFSKILPEALGKLSQEERSHITLTQQCRPELLDATQKAYDDLKMSVTLQSFFENMQDLYEKADLIIARSGASTVSEITVAGRAALFIPYPHAMDNHQFYNAKALNDSCTLYEQKDLSASTLSEILKNCLANPKILEKKARSIQNYSMVNAASNLAQVIQDLLPPL